MRKRSINGRKSGKTICQNCGIEFEKPMSEITRNDRLNRPNFCCRSCVGKHNSKNFGDPKSRPGAYQHHGGRQEDKYTKFRYHFRTIHNRSIEREIEMTITIDDLIDQWNIQKGICEFTGVQLILSSYSKIKKDPIFSASVDRIESSKGYSKNNIRWVSRSINWMKNEMSDEMTWKLCRLISENMKKKEELIKELPDYQ